MCEFRAVNASNVRANNRKNTYIVKTVLSLMPKSSLNIFVWGKQIAFKFWDTKQNNICLFSYFLGVFLCLKKKVITIILKCITCCTSFLVHLLRILFFSSYSASLQNLVLQSLLLVKHFFKQGFPISVVSFHIRHYFNFFFSY